MHRERSIARYPYHFGEFGILAVSLAPSTNKWDDFLFTVADWLIPDRNDAGIIYKYQPVPPEPNAEWTRDLAECIGRYWTWKRRRGESLDPNAPLFANQSGRRISKRLQHAWTSWQQRAGFDRAYGFHALRHTAVTNVYRSSRDLFLAQRFARHVSPLTTTAYTHPSELIAASNPFFSFTARTLAFCAGFSCRTYPMYFPWSLSWERRLGVSFNGRRGFPRTPAQRPVLRPDRRAFRAASRAALRAFFAKCWSDCSRSAKAREMEERLAFTVRRGGIRKPPRRGSVSRL